MNALTPGNHEGPDFTRAEDPFDLFARWLAEAEAAEINDPNAMAVASVDADGLPDVRMVLLKGWDRDGFVFYSNVESNKGRQLEGAPKAALLFHWKSLGRQVRIRGEVSEVAAAEADDYFASRPRDSRIGAWASRQSRPLESREALLAAIAGVERRFAGQAVPRPPYWRGFRVNPLRMEFWHDRPFRLHDRVLFMRETIEGAFLRERLYP